VWVPAREVAGLFPAPAAQPAPAPTTPAAAAPASEKSSPHPANGLKVQPLIDSLLQPGEVFQYGITGELSGGWTVRTFVAALTSNRLLLIEKKKFSWSGEVAKEWIAFPLSAVRVSFKNYLLSASVTIHVTEGTTYTLDKIPKDAASRFEGLF